MNFYTDCLFLAKQHTMLHSHRLFTSPLNQNTLQHNFRIKPMTDNTFAFKRNDYFKLKTGRFVEPISLVTCCLSDSNVVIILLVHFALAHHLYLNMFVAYLKRLIFHQKVSLLVCSKFKICLELLIELFDRLPKLNF
jgi:hypothetical protein